MDKQNTTISNKIAIFQNTNRAILRHYFPIFDGKLHQRQKGTKANEHACSDGDRQAFAE